MLFRVFRLDKNTNDVDANNGGGGRWIQLNTQERSGALHDVEASGPAVDNDVAG